MNETTKVMIEFEARYRGQTVEIRKPENDVEYGFLLLSGFEYFPYSDVMVRYTAKDE